MDARDSRRGEALVVQNWTTPGLVQTYLGLKIDSQLFEHFLER
jgi:hypothetical protein